MTHLTTNAAGMACLRCPDCRAMVTLSANGDGLLRVGTHRAADGEQTCPASGAALGRVNAEHGKEQDDE